MEETPSLLDLEEEEMMIHAPSQSAKFSINNYLRKKQDFISVNLFIQMEYLKS